MTPEQQMTKGRWLTNIYDPMDPDARLQTFGQSSDAASTSQPNYLSDKMIGEPKATRWYTVDELKALKIVGVYERQAPP